MTNGSLLTCTSSRYSTTADIICSNSSTLWHRRVSAYKYIFQEIMQQHLRQGCKTLCCVIVYESPSDELDLSKPIAFGVERHEWQLGIIPTWSVQPLVAPLTGGLCHCSRPHPAHWLRPAWLVSTTHDGFLVGKTHNTIILRNAATGQGACDFSALVGIVSELPSLVCGRLHNSYSVTTLQDQTA
jgi:hypothetical protein